MRGRNIIRTLGLLFLIMPALYFSLPAGAGAVCMSCISHTGTSYTELACEGDSRFDVMRKCGKPDYVEETESVTSGELGPRRRSFGAVTEKVERLYYNCGSGRFVKVLVFRGGRLVSIEDGDRGSGEQKCW